jgi:hypothetical protein
MREGYVCRCTDGQSLTVAALWNTATEGVRFKKYCSEVIKPMKTELPDAELKRLRREQSKSRQDEVFGGFSSQERADYKDIQSRIRDLEGSFPVFSEALAGRDLWKS